MFSRRSELLIAPIVVCAHLVALDALIAPARIASTYTQQDEQPSITAVLLTPKRAARDESPAPMLRLSPVAIGPIGAISVEFDDPDKDIVPGVIAPMSVPRAMPSSDVDVRIYASHAGLLAGESMTVLLEIEVKEDGSVGQATVRVGSGSAQVDEQALLYARALHWIPGSIDRHARTMRIRYPITLKG